MVGLQKNARRSCIKKAAAVNFFHLKIMQHGYLSSNIQYFFLNNINKIHHINKKSSSHDDKYNNQNKALFFIKAASFTGIMHRAITQN